MLRRLGSGTLLLPERLAGWAATLGVDHVAIPEERLEQVVPALLPGGPHVADVFPRGVLGEMAPPSILVSRWVPPRFYLDPDVRRTIESRVELLVWGEEPPDELASLAVPSVRVGPILLGEPPLSREEGRSRLGAPDAARLVLALPSGDAAGQARLTGLLVKVTARLGATLVVVSDVLPPIPPVVRFFPAARLLPAADAVVSAAGYHAFHEIALSGVPAVFLPEPRRYDDQARRAAGWPIARSPRELEALLGAGLERGRRQPVVLPDGAAAVARLIERRVERGVLLQEEVAAVARGEVVP